MNYCSAMFRDVLLNLHNTLTCHYLGSRIAVFFEAMSGTCSWVCQHSFIHEAEEMLCVHTALPFTPGFLKHRQCILLNPHSSTLFITFIGVKDRGSLRQQSLFQRNLLQIFQ